MWPAWRLVLARVVTLDELRTTWSPVDMLDANEALDEKEAAEAFNRAQREAAAQAAAKKG